jgi:eukaryotic-like serine/threonine-protein kinase
MVGRGCRKYRCPSGREISFVFMIRPSTRLSTTVGADVLNLSKHHGTEVPRLIRETRGDLDWMVMKALEKDRERRYATANAFAMDVGR